jgi:hypothetical protein
VAKTALVYLGQHDKKYRPEKVTPVVATAVTIALQTNRGTFF